MAKKKKGNMRNIQTGDTVQFLNYLTPNHILRGKYNTGNNELDITDVPANLNSVITLGQGGGGGDFTFAEVTVINTGTGYFNVPGLAIIDEDSNYIIAGTDDNSVVGAGPGATRIFSVILYKGRAVGWVSSGTVTSTAGDIEYDGDNSVYYVTGDCTITGEGA